MPMYTGMNQYNMMPSYGNTQPAMNQQENQQPYAYGMTNENPMPQQPSPISSLPPLFPSMLTPQLNPQAPFTTQNQMQARYARGGQVHHGGLSHMAEMLREQGDQDDTILAHINPQEADYLAQNFGVDRNTHTGLPQFGKFSRAFKKVTHPIKKIIPKEAVHIIRKSLPVIGAVVGNALLPGVGGVLGGTLGGALSTKKPGKGALRGLGLGAGLGFGAPMIGKGLSAMGASNIGGGLSAIGGGQYGQGLGMLGKAIGMGGEQGQGGAGPLGGLGKILGMGGRKTPTQGAEEAPESQQGGGGGGLLGNILGSGGLGGLLLPAGILGTALRKEKMKPAYPQPSFENVAAQAGPQALSKMFGPESAHQPVVPFQRQATEIPEEEFDPYKRYQTPAYYKGYSTGGQVATGGYIHGDSGGQDDNVERAIPENSYIVNATAVSHLGDGNSLAGAKKLDHFFHNLKSHRGLSRYQMHQGGTPHKHVDAMVSEGEYEILPHSVAMLGKGDIKKGIKMLDNLQKNILAHKRTKGLPPKAKSLMVYMQQRSAR